MNILVLLASMMTARAGSIVNLQLDFTPKEVNAVAEYSIIFNIESGVQADSIVMLEFPPEVELADSSDYPCSVEYRSSEVSGVQCQSASRVVKIFNVFGEDIASSFFDWTITIPSVTNPISTSPTQAIAISTLTAAEVPIDSTTGNSNMQITAEIASLVSVAISPSSDVIGALTSWAFTIEPKYEIPIGATIQVTFPYWNEGITATGVDLLDFIRVSNPSCTGDSNIGTISCSFTDQTLTVNNGFDQARTGAIGFTVSSVYNPPSGSAVNGFSVKLIDSSGGEMEESGANSISVSVSTPNSINDIGIFIDNDLISASTIYYVRFKVTNPIFQGCLVDVTFPDEVTLLGSITVRLGSTELSSSKQGASTIRITDAFTSYDLPTSFITFEFSTLTNPSSTAMTENFTVTTLDASQQPIDSGSGGAFEATAGSITQFSTFAIVTANEVEVGKETTYVFHFQTSHSIPSGGVILIVFPSAISVQDRDASTACTSISAGLGASAKCQVVGQDLTILDAFDSTFPAGEIMFSIDLVTNPLTTAESGSFSITSYTSSSLQGGIDTITTGVTITASPSPLISVTVTTDSQITGDNAVYTFRIETNNPVTINGYVEIKFPTDIYFIDNGLANTSCTKIAGFNGNSFTCNAQTSTLTVNGFDLGSFGPGILEFSIGSVKNPPSTRVYQSFEVTTYNSNDNEIDQTKSGIGIQVSEPNDLQSAVASSSSDVNSELSTYTFTIVVENKLPTGSKVKLTPPPTVEFQPAPSCAGVTSVTSVTCKIVDSTNVEATLTLPAEIASGGSFAFSVSSVKNPPTTQQSDSFSVETFTSDDFKIDKLDSGVTVKTSQATPIQSITIGAQDSKISAQTSYTISFTTENEYPADATMAITIPTEFTIDSLGHSSATFNSGYVFVAANKQITISSFLAATLPEGSSLDLTLTGFTNPDTSLNPSTAWQLEVRTGSFLIDESSDQVSVFTCTNPCFTCSGTPTDCLSCNPDSSTPYFYGGTCNAACPTGETDPIDTAEKECVACNSPCVDCQDSVDKCTDCGGSTPYLYNDTCNENCNVNQYGVGLTCVDCPNPCASCTDASTCTSCTTETGTDLQTYLLGANCLTECGNDYFEDDSSFICSSCDSNCETCDGSATTCTSCDSSLRLKEGECVLNCPTDDRYIDDGTSCLKCTEPCFKCETQLNNCIACIDNYFLNGNECLTQCPSGTFQGTNRCYDCQSPCETCSTGTQICDTCENGYLKQDTTCKTVCDPGYLSNGVECQSCDSSCLTCATTITQCTSCSSPLFLHEEACVASCPADTHIADSGVCTPCDASCSTCSGTPTTCRSCPGGQVLFENACQATCPDDVSVEVDGECQSCNSSCKSCAGDVNTCTECESPLLLQSGECVSQCSAQYILNGNVCDPCDSSCFDCSGSTNICTSCPTGSYLYVNICVTECPTDYVISSGECIPNNTECANGCDDVLLNNDVCDDVCNFAACNYDNTKCNTAPTTCESGKYQSGTDCLDCQAPCANCLSPSTCETCQIDSVTNEIWFLYNNFCYQTCPDGTAQNGIICEDCFPRCSSCSSSSSTDCLACNDGYFLYDFQCVSVCPSGVSILLNDVCEACDSSCASCETSITNCTSCPDDKVLQGSQCKENCDSGYTVTTSSNSVCRQCTGCVECETSTTNCTECSQNQFLYEGSCLSSCPDGTYESGNVCISCEISCVLCSGKNNCSVCASDYFKFGTQCLSSCPAGYEDNSGTCVIISATECSPGCTDDLLNNDVCDDVCDNDLCNKDNQNCDNPCNSGEYYDGSTCIACTGQCSQCTSDTICTACVDDSEGNTQYAYNGSCVSTCPANTLLIEVACFDCNASCTACAGTVDTCIECPDGKFLSSGDCLDECPVGVTIELDGNLCEPCASSCATCENSIDNCTSCPSDKVLQGSKCVNDCSDGFSISTANPNECQACTNNCATCSGEPSSCDSCVSPYLLFENACYSTCPSNQSINMDGQCVPCQSPCSECVNSILICISCVSNYYLYNNQCLDSCPSGFDARLGVCEAHCADSCSLVELYNDTCEAACNSLECNNDNGQCESSSCPTGEYLDGDTCTACPSLCADCDDNDDCTACGLDPSSNEQLLLYNGDCLLNCPTSTYKDGAICKACDSNCYECEGTADHCTVCEGVKLLSENSCVDSCPENVTVPLLGVCEPCVDSCAECSGSTDNCTKCYDNAYMSQGNCILECDVGYITSSETGNCIQCDNSCLSCSGDTTNCISCKTGFILYNNTCIAQCPDGMTNTVRDPDVCTACSSNCVKCEDSEFFCTECASGLTLSESGKCQQATSCPDGSTLTSSSLTACQTCDVACSTCENEVDNCVTCAEGYLLDGGSCQACTSPCMTCSGSLTTCQSCIDGYYLSGNTCLACDSSCKTCSGSSSNCTSCNTGFLFDSNTNTCLACDDPLCSTCEPNVGTCTECNEGSFNNGVACEECDSNCKTCVDNNFKCTSCDSGKYLTGSDTCADCGAPCSECETTSTTCTACPDGQDLVNSTCGSCNSECATCVTDFNTCGSCEVGKDLVDGSCVICDPNCLTCVTDGNTCGSCVDGKYLRDGSCLDCDSSCKTCQNTSTECLSCNTPLLLDGTSCVTCDSNCATCSGSITTCTSCEDGYSLIIDTCEVCTNNCRTCFGNTSTCLSCQDGYYLSGTSCLECNSNCLTCVDTHYQCTACPTGQVLSSSNECILECPTGSSIINNACVVCDSPCVTCVNTSSTCASCSSGQTVSGGTCVACQSPCAECSGSATNCTSCLSGILSQGTCIDACPDGQYLNGSACSACDAACKTCSGSATTCTSCVAGQEVVGGTCVLDCDDGYFLSAGACEQCSDNCNTCQSSATSCTSCNNSDEVVNGSGVCEVPCPTGQIRTASSGEECVSCSSDCATCSNTVNNCTECSNSALFLYNGACLTECPASVTVVVTNYCQDCENNCLTCETTAYTCTSCQPGFYLFGVTCVAECPEGYELIDGVCCDDPESCAPPDDTEEPEEFDEGVVPFPFTIATVVSVGAIGGVSLVTVGTSFVATTLALWSATATVSWGFLAIAIPAHDGNEPSRRLFSTVDSARALLEIDPANGSATLSVAFILILGGLLFLYLCNAFFMFKFCRNYYKKDKDFAGWRDEHKIITWVALVLSAGLSFHCIKLLYCKLCGKEFFSAKFTQNMKLYKMLVLLAYVNVLCTCVPLVAAQILLLVYFSVSNWMWMFSLDSLIVTLLLLLMQVVEIITMEKRLTELEYNKDLNDPLSKIVGMMPGVDLRHLIPAGFDKLYGFNKVKGQSKSIAGSRPETPREERRRPHLRKLSFPLDKDTPIEIDPNLFPPPEANIIDEPLGEEKANIDSSFLEGSTIIESKELKGEFEKTVHETKAPSNRKMQPVYAAFDSNPRIEEETEIVAFTEEASEEEQEPENYEEIVEKQSEYKNKYEAPLGTIEEEEDIALNLAIADSTDPEVVTVPHKVTGERIKIRKDFRGSRVVDLVGEVIEGVPPIDPSKYHIPSTIVDEKDVRFATLLDYSGDRVRVKRSFKGARIIDLEKKAKDPLIGQSVEAESDFGFSSGYPDPDDPEVVVVSHEPTGEEVKVRKTFHGAVLVDERGNDLPDGPTVDRSDYDISKTVVDRNNVHLATLSHRITHAKVRVRRDFKGAKIIDLERKAENRSSVREKSEPEPLSPSFSQQELKLGWISPGTQERPLWKIPPRQQQALKPIKLDGPPRPEHDFARERLANLASIINTFDGSEKEWGTEEFTDPMYKQRIESAEESFDSRPPLRNVDFEPSFIHEPPSRNADFEHHFIHDEPVFDRFDSHQSFNSKKKIKKRPPKVPESSDRMKDLEHIYLKRLPVNKKEQRIARVSPDLGEEPEWEFDDSPIEMFKPPPARDRPPTSERKLGSAGEEIIFGRSRKH